MSNTKIFGSNRGISTQQVIPDNQVALEIESTDAKEYIEINTSDSAPTIILGKDGAVVGVNDSAPSAQLSVKSASTDTSSNGSIQIRTSDNNKGILLSTLNTNEGRVEMFKGGTSQTLIDARTGVVHNEQGISTYDFRVESDNQTHMLFVDASENTFSIASTEDTISIGGSLGGKISFARAGGVAISAAHASGSLYFQTGGGVNRAHLNNVGYFGVGDLSPTAMIGIKGNLGTALPNQFTNSGATVTSTAHNLVAGSAVKLPTGTSSALEVFTVSSVTDANTFVVDSTPTENEGSAVNGFTDPSPLKILTGDGATALEYTNQRRLICGDGKGNVTIRSAGDLSTGPANMTGQYNTTVGFEAGLNNSGGNDNTYLGKSAGRGCSSYSNTAVGTGALSGATGATNTAVGLSALGGAYTGTASVGIGTECLDAGDADNSVAVGYRALTACTANDSTAVGYQAGLAHTSGTGCVYIGKGSNTSSATSANQIAIGADTTCDAASKAVIGDSSNPATLDFSGSGNSWSTTSDERIKENIQGSSLGLSFINALRPITHTAKNPADWPDEIKPPIFSERTESRKDADGNDVDVIIPPASRPDTVTVIKDGLLAQEVKAVMDAQGVGFSGWTEQVNGLQRIQYERLVLPLIKSVQELTARIEVLENGE